MPIDTGKTGAAIAACRQRMKLSQQGLADLMNVTHQAVSKWENGLALPDTETLLALSKLFQTSMENLLMGTVEPDEEPQPSAPEEPQEPRELPELDFAALQSLLPFVSTKVADRLFRQYAQADAPDIHKLISVAPFVSTKALNEYILAHPLADYSPEMLCALAPFLSTGTVDALIRGLNGPVPAHMMHALLPFASTKMVDEMVVAHLPPEDGEAVSEMVSAVSEKLKSLDSLKSLNGLGEKISAAIQQKMQLSAVIEQKLQSMPEDCESPRMRKARRAIEEDDEDELCECAEELNPGELRTICLLALEHGMYGALEELVDGLDERAVKELAAIAKETGDEELLEILAENL